MARAPHFSSLSLQTLALQNAAALAADQHAALLLGGFHRVEVVRRGQNSTETLRCRLPEILRAAPRLHDGGARKIGMQDLVPTDHALVVAYENARQTLIEVRLQRRVVGKMMRSHELLDARALFPLRCVDLISADMPVRVGKER